MSIRPVYAFLSFCLLAVAVGRPVLLAQSSDVIIDGRAVLQIRTKIKGVTAEARARAIEERIVRYASDPYFNTGSITVDETDISSDIIAGDQILMSVLDVDAQAWGRSRQELAAQYAQALRAAIDQYRRDHSRRNILKSSLFALLTTIGLIIILFVLKRLSSKLECELPVWAYMKLVPDRIKKYHLIEPNQFSTLICKGIKFIRIVIVLVLLHFYLGLVFSFFPWTQGLASKLFDLVIGPLKTFWQGIRNQVPNLFFILILVLVTRYLLKLMKAFFSGIENGTIEMMKLDRDLALPTYKILRIFVIAFAATIAYPYIPGSESEAFKGVSIFLGVLLSLGSTSFVSNVIAGLTMTYMRAFKIGDRVKIDEIMGDVVATYFQVTQIKSVKNEIISVPNAKIINSSVINYTALAQKQGLILHTTVGIGYDVPWRQVHAMLLIAAEKTPGLLREPPPFVFQKSLGDFSITYEINAYTNQAHIMGRIYSNLHKNILDQFNEYGVQIMTPNYEEDRKAPAVVPKENWYAAPADRFTEREPEASKDQNEEKKTTKAQSA